MAAGTYDTIMDQGSDFTLQLTVKENGVAKDLSLYTARAQMRSSLTASAITATFVCAIPDAINGIITMELSNSITIDISPGMYYYDLELFTAGEAAVIKLIRGKITVRGEVTR